MAAEDTQQILRQMDNRSGVNQSKLQLSLQDYEEEVEEDKEESVSWEGKKKNQRCFFATDSGFSSSFLPTYFHIVMHVGCMMYKTPEA